MDRKRRIISNIHREAVRSRAEQGSSTLSGKKCPQCGHELTISEFLSDRCWGCGVRPSLSTQEEPTA